MTLTSVSMACLFRSSISACNFFSYAECSSSWAGSGSSAFSVFSSFFPFSVAFACVAVLAPNLKIY